MKTIQVPFIADLEKRNCEEIASILETAGCRQMIDQVNWPKAFPYQPIAAFDIARSQTHIIIRYFVKGNDLRAVNAHNNDPVWQDSCVEFFVQHEGFDGYYNFEFNCIGACLAAKRKSRTDFVYLNDEQHHSILRYPSLGTDSFEEKKGNYSWELTVAIPFELFGLMHNNLPQSISANFYKCGDETSTPHYVSWNPIGTENPDFHCPQYFGKLLF